MGKKSKEIEDDEEFVGEPEEKFDENKFLRTRKIAYLISLITILIVVILDLTLVNYRDIENTIVAWFGVYLWILPILFYQMRYYKFSLRIFAEEKPGKLYTLMMLYSIIAEIACLISLFLLKLGPPILLVPILEWVALLGLIPGLLLIVIIKN